MMLGATCLHVTVSLFLQALATPSPHSNQEKFTEAVAQLLEARTAVFAERTTRTAKRVDRGFAVLLGEDRAVVETYLLHSITNAILVNADGTEIQVLGIVCEDSTQGLTLLALQSMNYARDKIGVGSVVRGEVDSLLAFAYDDSSRRGFHTPHWIPAENLTPNRSGLNIHGLSVGLVEGGPAIDRQGRLIGIVSATERNSSRNYLVLSLGSLVSIQKIKIESLASFSLRLEKRYASMTPEERRNRAGIRTLEVWERHLDLPNDSGSHLSERKTFDAEGKILISEDIVGDGEVMERTQLDYDGNGRLISKRLRDGAGTTLTLDSIVYRGDSLVTTTRWDYDQLSWTCVERLDHHGNVVSQMVTHPDGSLLARSYFEFTYSKLGTLQKSIMHSLNTDLRSKSTVISRHDKYGRRIATVSSPLRTVGKYIYDETTGGIERSEVKHMYGDDPSLEITKFANDIWGNPVYCHQKVVSLKTGKTLSETVKSFNYGYSP